MKKIISLVMAVLLCALTFTACGKKEEAKTDETAAHQKIKFTMESGDSFVIETYPEYAPETCANFISLVKSHFYDGLTFHRIVEGFMAQGGSSDGKGYKGADKTIKGEFAQNGFTKNTLKHERGVVSMARTGDPNSASSQFFICYDTASFLDGAYAAFGKVVEGMEVVDGFTKIETVMNMEGEKSQPVTPIVIKTAEVVK